MASILKRQKRKNEPYTIQYFDHLGKRRTKKAFTDKGLSEELAAKLGRQVKTACHGSCRRRAGPPSSAQKDHLASFKKSLTQYAQAHHRHAKSYRCDCDGL
jgi:hypothetical protein